MRRFGRIGSVFLSMLAAFAWGGAALCAAVLPQGFVETVYAPLIPDPRAFGFLPDGRVIVGAGSGKVYLADGVHVTQVGAITTTTNGEQGLNGLAVDPEFSENGHIWIYYTVPAPAHNRVSRFTLANNQLGDEVVVLEGPETLWAFHTSGCLRFDVDGTLFISVGDDSQYSTTAQDPYDIRGKILHINRDGTPAAGNPFLLGGGDPRVWAMGFRNPYRFNIQPGATGTPNLFIGDVGAETHEEISIGLPGGNFGWAEVEGPNPPGLPGYVYPIYAYPHAGTGASVIGGDHVKPGVFTPEYTGDYIFGDWVRSTLYRMKLDASNQVISVETWATGVPGPSDIQFGPDGALYYAAENAGAIRRIAYVGGPNDPPVAAGQAIPDSGPAPLTVTLDGSASHDPEGDTLTSVWVPGDGSASEVGAQVTHVYGPGVFYPQLTVTDLAGGHDSTPPIRVVSGNVKPTAVVTAPTDGAHYNAGEAFDFTGTNSDPEEAWLPCARYTWRVLFHHNEHVHPYLGPVQGICGGQFTTADLGETSPNTWYEIALAVDDTGVPLGPEGVLTGQQSSFIYPNLATMTFETQPLPDLLLTLDTQPFTPPLSVTGVVNFRRTIGAPDQLRPDGHTWRWLSWSDGGARDRELLTPAVDTTYTATFGCNVMASVDGLMVRRQSNDFVRLSWDAVLDTCLSPSNGRYRIYATDSATPWAPPGSFPDDPAFHLVGTTRLTSFTFKPKVNENYFIVVAVGTDQLDGFVDHYGK